MNPLCDVAEVPPQARFLDARFRLERSEAAKNLFLNEHIPGATHLDLETELSGKKNGRNGRHPLPERASLENLFSRLGIGTNTAVVAYDDSDHAGAARLWMLLRWMGHEKVQVLNGGLKAWKGAGRAVESGATVDALSTKFSPRDSLVTLVPREKLFGQLLVDARAPERYRGEMEPLDPIAGHIPGAKNLFYKSLLQADGTFLPDSELRNRIDFDNPVFYCGSGVTGAVLLLAATRIGRAASLYPGSYSEWCSIPDAPIETG